MGEYAKYGSQRIKIGTCEDMYYLRWDQAHKVTPETGSVDPITNRGALRFRFPFPEEDGVAPGAFEDYERHLALYGVTVPEGVEHSTIQMTQNYPHKGYVASFPCPMGPDALAGVTFHKNGWGGDVRLVQQAWRGGRLVAICECGGCGARYNLPTLEDVEPIVVSLRSQADRARNQTPADESTAARLHEVAARITAGYMMTDAELVTT